MKIIIPLSLVFVGCILATGCVGQMKQATGNITTVSPTSTFTSFLNVTNISDIPRNVTTPGLNGSLRISLRGLVATLPVSIDGKIIGNVTPTDTLYLYPEEGNHTVEVCCGTVCNQENVTVKFGKQQSIDFSERLQKNCEFFEPTVRIVGSSQNDNHVQISVEFINPTTQTHRMSAEITVGYTYIDDRSNNRESNFVQGQAFTTLKPGDRITQMLDLRGYSSGSSYMYNIPVITKVSLT